MSETAKTKILLVITKSNFGGAQRYVYDLATSLPHENFEVVVVFGEGGELEEKLKTAGIRTIKINSLQRDVNFLKDFSVLFELIKIFKTEKPAVVHLNSSKIGGVGALAGRLSGVHKIIFTAHGWAFNEKRSLPSKTIIAFIQWLTVVLCHKTIAVSQKTADQILKFPFINSKKIKVIYNGVGTINFLEKENAREAVCKGAVKYTKWIGTISELHKNKGLDIAIDAFASVSKTHTDTAFVIIGAGEEKENLNKQINELGLTDRVFLAGFITDAKNYLKAFDIFTLTSRTEALPYAISEAGLANLPVIASAVGGIPEIIPSSEYGILIPTQKISGKTAGKEKTEKETSQKIAEAIETLLNQPEQAKNLGQNLNNRITSNFSVTKMHQETFDLYKS